MFVLQCKNVAICTGSSDLCQKDSFFLIKQNRSGCNLCVWWNAVRWPAGVICDSSNHTARIPQYPGSGMSWINIRLKMFVFANLPQGS